MNAIPPGRDRSVRSVKDRQQLNPLDVALHAADQTIRALGYAGFETQMLIWLAGRVNVVRLRRAVQRLAARHPVITSRLVAPDDGSSAQHWRYQTEVAARLQEIDLPADTPQAVFDRAAELISQPQSLASEPPLRFHLLHRPGGSDVLLLQYSHVLMDNGAAPLLVKELDGLSDEANADDQPRYEPGNPARSQLRALPREARKAASLAAFKLNAYTLRGRAAILGTGEEDRPRTVPLRIVTRTYSSELTHSVIAQSARLCGFPNLSMTVLAVAFRAIQRHSPPSRNADRNYVAGIGLDLGLRRAGNALLQNLLSLVPISARSSELADRNGLIRLLAGQMRDRLQARIDLGILRLVQGFQRRPRHMRWVTDHMLRWSYSLWYAYFGSLDNIRTLCDIPVEHCCYVGPTWSPLGLALLVNQFGGRLHMQMTFDPALIAPSLADEWLDSIGNELEELAAG